METINVDKFVNTIITKTQKRKKNFKINLNDS